MATNYSLSTLPAGAFTMSPDNAYDLMRKHDLVIVDVRDPGEFVTGHIEGARLLPLSEILAGNTAGLPEDKSVPLFLYCRSGMRSGTAAEVLAAQGYAHVANFGGVLDWPYGLVTEAVLKA